MADLQLSLLRQFVSACRADISILHRPEMAFYKEYLESLGASIPPKPADPPQDRPTSEHREKEKMEESSAEEETAEIPPPELDNSGVIEPDNESPLPMGDASRTSTDEDLEKANDLRDQANAAFSEGDYPKAVDQYTQAIELNPGSAILHAKRANALLKLKKPVAAIRDCDHAISINPDSAQGYKFRGRANRLLGNWADAHKDLATACKLDFDETAYEWLKEVEPNAKKLQEYQRAKERADEERKLNERRERVKRAQEANKRATEEEAEMDEGDESGFGMGAFNELFKELADDPELLKMMKEDPALPGKLMEVMSNPQNMMKYMGDPAVMKLIGKLGAKFGAGGGPGFPGGAPSSAPGTESDPSSEQKAPPPKHTFTDDVD